MKSFNPGDRVVIVRSFCPERIGTVATVVSGLRPVVANRPSPHGWLGKIPRDSLVHELDLQPLTDGAVVAYPPDLLELYRPDHNEKLSTTDEPVSELLPRTIRDLCSAGDAERAKRKVRV